MSSRCQCPFSGPSDTILGCHRDPISSEKGWLDFAVRELSRVAAGKARGQEAVWRSQCKPAWWDCACRHPWKNPTANPKDSKDTLREKFECLVQHLRKVGQLPKDMEKEIDLWEADRKPAVFLMTSLSSLLRQASNLHALVEDTCPKIEESGTSVDTSILSDLQNCLTACFNRLESAKSMADKRNQKENTSKAARGTGSKRQHCEKSDVSQPPCKRPKQSSCPSPSASQSPILVQPPSTALTSSQSPILVQSPSTALTSSQSPILVQSPSTALTSSQSPILVQSPSTALTSPQSPILVQSPSTALTSSPSPTFITSSTVSHALTSPDQSRLLMAALQKQILEKRSSKFPPLHQAPKPQVPLKPKAVPVPSNRTKGDQGVGVLGQKSVATMLPSPCVPATASQHSVSNTAENTEFRDFLELDIESNAEDSDCQFLNDSQFLDKLLLENSPDVIVSDSPAAVSPTSDPTLVSCLSPAFSRLPFTTNSDTDSTKDSNHDPLIGHSLSTGRSDSSPFDFGVDPEAVAGQVESELTEGGTCIGTALSSGVGGMDRGLQDTEVVSDSGYNSESSVATSHRESLDSDLADLDSPDLEAYLKSLDHF
ncbi:uncharacterized protein LOC143285547 [Babylonia areolata]|uniref:uncharacterized protein LOC143285547 n=1 Tax=Babylonia areolata TaxID=304850 RepID=UPI003FD2671A